MKLLEADRQAPMATPAEEDDEELLETDELLDMLDALEVELLELIDTEDELLALELECDEFALELELVD